jgi:hypothetical protein
MPAYAHVRWYRVASYRCCAPCSCDVRRRGSISWYQLSCAFDVVESMECLWEARNGLYSPLDRLKQFEFNFKRTCCRPAEWNRRWTLISVRCLRVFRPIPQNLPEWMLSKNVSFAPRCSTTYQTSSSPRTSYDVPDHEYLCSIIRTRKSWSSISWQVWNDASTLCLQACIRVLLNNPQSYLLSRAYGEECTASFSAERNQHDHIRHRQIKCPLLPEQRLYSSFASQLAATQW